MGAAIISLVTPERLAVKCKPCPCFSQDWGRSESTLVHEGTFLTPGNCAALWHAQVWGKGCLDSQEKGSALRWESFRVECSPFSSCPRASGMSGRNVGDAAIEAAPAIGRSGCNQTCRVESFLGRFHP